MTKSSGAPCAICGGPLDNELLIIIEPDRFEKYCGVTAEGYRRRWVECSDCGAVTDELSAESVNKLTTLRSGYYEVDFAGSDIGEKYRKVMTLPPNQSDNAGRVIRILDFLRLWMPALNQPRVLDIGAGTGVFLSRFLELAGPEWKGIGVEPDPHAATHLRSLKRFEVVEAFYWGQPELKRFTLVTLNKVLEHIPDPITLLKKVTHALSPDGSILYVELPDKLTIKRRPPGDNILGSLHCHLYNPRSLIHSFHECGMEILKIERIIEPSGKITVFGFACLPATLSRI